MKKIFLLILLPVSLFFSCVGDRIASETMDRAEILLEANPDSAYILLNEVKTPDRVERAAVCTLVHAVLPGGG